ncbi:MAG TPA: YihY/virulence factor BrkB family protein [Dehalococcoidia bacterium]
MIGSFWRYLKHAVRQYGLDNCPQLAAAISYYVLFSIVPLTFVVVSVFGIVIRSDRIRAEVVQRVVDTLGIDPGEASIQLDDARLSEHLDGPAITRLREAVAGLSDAQKQQLAADIRDRGRAQIGDLTLQDRDVILHYSNTISDTLNAVQRASAQLTVVSLLLSAWSASAMFGAVRRAINAVWHVEYQRPYFQQKVKDLAMVVSFGIMLLASIVATAALAALRHVSDDFLGPLSSGTSVLWVLAAYLLPAGLTFAVFVLLYRFVPALPVRVRDVWFGALVATLLFTLMTNLFAVYVSHFHAYTILYGSLGGILLFLTGVYFASAILLMGSELTAAMPGLRAGAFAPAGATGAPKVGLARELWREAGKFLRGLVLPPRSTGGDDASHGSSGLGPEKR